MIFKSRKLFITLFSRSIRVYISAFNKCLVFRLAWCIRELFFHFSYWLQTVYFRSMLPLPTARFMKFKSINRTQIFLPLSVRCSSWMGAAFLLVSIFHFWWTWIPFWPHYFPAFSAYPVQNFPNSTVSSKGDTFRLFKSGYSILHNFTSSLRFRTRLKLVPISPSDISGIDKITFLLN